MMSCAGVQISAFMRADPARLLGTGASCPHCLWVSDSDGYNFLCGCDPGSLSGGKETARTEHEQNCQFLYGGKGEGQKTTTTTKNQQQPTTIKKTTLLMIFV